jgi:putative heme iron utilization protein
MTDAADDPDEEDEQEDPAADVRRWLLTTPIASMATLSADPETEGFPFGSVVPFALTPEGEPFILTASIAQHTRNLRRDPRASLLVQEPVVAGGDPQAGWRVTLLGRMRPIDADAALHARYAERVPDSPAYLETHDFAYWKMDVTRVRSIAGFGRIGWVEAAAIRRDPLGEGLAEAAPAIIEHMNTDHADALLAMCAAFRDVRPARAEIVAVDRTGFLVRADGAEMHHFSFGREIRAADAREAFVALTREARARLAGR